MPHIKTIQKYSHVLSEHDNSKIAFAGYLFVYELVLSRRLKTHCILQTEENSSNLDI